MASSPWNTLRKGRRVGLKSQPLRLPGESTDERIRDLQEHWGELLLVPAFLSVLAIVEWLYWFNALRPNPWIPTITAIFAIGYVAIRSRSLIAHVRRLRFGMHGERCVAEILDGLREQGYRVFHDVPGDRFNIDHVIVGSAGIFAIETKARTKVDGTRHVVYDGNTLRIEDGQPFDDPLNQARAQARWLANLINDGRRTRIAVRPVVAYPEWYVDRTSRPSATDVWVVNPKELPGFLRNERRMLSLEQIDAVSAVLTTYCRTRIQVTRGELT